MCVIGDWCSPFAGFPLYVPTREQMPSQVRAPIDVLIEKRDAAAATGSRAANVLHAAPPRPNRRRARDGSR